MSNIDEWYESLGDAGKDYAQTHATMMVCLQFSELARKAATDAEANLQRALARRTEAAQDFARMRRTASTPELRAMHDRLAECDLSVASWCTRSAAALEHLIRTTTTLELSVRLHAMGRR